MAPPAPPPTYPIHGVLLSHLKTWFLQHTAPPLADPNTITTGEFVAKVVIPETLSSQVALIELFPSAVRADKATLFVSHAWGGRFLDTLETVEKQMGSECFIWCDAVVVNQHETKTTSPEFYSTMFHEAIAKIGHTCAVLAPYDNPIALRRSWCLWELLGTIQNSQTTKLTIAFPERERLFMLNTMKTNSKALIASLCFIDAKNAHAQYEVDETRIRDAIIASVGFDRVNAAVIAPLRAWLLQTAMDELLRMEQQGNPPNELAEMQNLVGLLHYDMGKLSSSMEAFQHAVRIRETMLAACTPSTTSYYTLQLQLSDDLTNLATSFVDAGRVAEALDMYSRVLLIRENPQVNASLVDQANTLNNIGLTLKSMDRHEESLDAFNRAMQLCSDKSSETFANALVNRGELMRAMGHPAEAVSELLKALQLKETILGVKHVNVAQVCNLIGQAYMDLQNYVQAKHYFELALEVRIKALGPLHQKVGLVLANLAKVDEANGDLDSAKERLELLLEGQIKEFGMEHEFTIATREELMRLEGIRSDGDGDGDDDRRPQFFRELSVCEPQHVRFEATQVAASLEPPRPLVSGVASLIEPPRPLVSVAAIPVVTADVNEQVVQINSVVVSPSLASSKKSAARKKCVVQ